MLTGATPSWWQQPGGESSLLTTYWSESTFITGMIWWTVLAPWEFEFPFGGSNLVEVEEEVDRITGHYFSNIFM